MKKVPLLVGETYCGMTILEQLFGIRAAEQQLRVRNDEHLRWAACSLW